jgi:hypothetical protein
VAATSHVESPAHYVPPVCWINDDSGVYSGSGRQEPGKKPATDVDPDASQRFARDDVRAGPGGWM